jgi:hypothetical protein
LPRIRRKNKNTEKESVRKKERKKDHEEPQGVTGDSVPVGSSQGGGGGGDDEE